MSATLQQKPKILQLSTVLTRDTKFIENTTAVLLHNYCCHGNATMSSLLSLHYKLQSIKLLLEALPWKSNDDMAFRVCGSLHLQIKHPTDATVNRKIYCIVTQTPLNMFRASLCPSSGAVYKLHSQPLVAV
jgi:hypothetical protein